MSVNERALAEARRWIGTPYRHQGAAEEAGSDCLGLLRGVWRALYGTEPEAPPAYTADWSEPAGDEALWRAVDRYLTAKRIGAESPGDVLLFRMRRGGVAKHLGVQGRPGPDASFVHAYSGHGVVESALSDPWARRIVARFAFPERND